MLEKAKGLPADQVFLDLEDACAPLVKPEARKNIVAALNEGGYGDKTVAVRVNDWTTHWTYRDVVEVVENAGANLDCIMLPKVQTAEQVVALDFLLTQIEKTMGFEIGRIGIEAQIENALGLTNVNAIAAASPRVETIIFGPADFMASINMKSLVVGEQPQGYDVGDAYVHGHSTGGIAHTVGASLRLDMAWFSFLEHTTLRFDFAKALHEGTPLQFWFGTEHPF